MSSNKLESLFIGLDVGSTTVKAVVVDPVSDEIVWKDYQRHDTKQPEKVLEFLERIENEFPGVGPNKIRVFVTGSGGGTLAGFIGAKFVQGGTEIVNVPSSLIVLPIVVPATET